MVQNLLVYTVLRISLIRGVIYALRTSHPLSKNFGYAQYKNIAGRCSPAYAGLHHFTLCSDVYRKGGA